MKPEPTTFGFCGGSGNPHQACSIETDGTRPAFHHAAAAAPVDAQRPITHRDAERERVHALLVCFVLHFSTSPTDNEGQLDRSMD